MEKSTQLATAPAKQVGMTFVSLAELADEQKKVLKDTVAKGTTDTELAYFLNVAFAQELDPFRKEVWCIKRAKKHKVGTVWDYKRNADGSIDYSDASLVIMTGRDGFLKMAKRDPTFDYIQSAEVRDGDHFVFDPITGHVEHRFGLKRGAIQGAYAVITRKDGVKIGKFVTFAEFYDDSSDVWKDNPTSMIVKCAESILCKQFANVTGIIAEEAMHKDGVAVDTSPAAAELKESLKTRLIAKIEACKKLTDLEALRDPLALELGKLFAEEQKEVMEVAKHKGEELRSLVVETEQAPTQDVPADAAPNEQAPAVAA